MLLSQFSIHYPKRKEKPFEYLCSIKVSQGYSSDVMLVSMNDKKLIGL